MADDYVKDLLAKLELEDETENFKSKYFFRIIYYI